MTRSWATSRAVPRDAAAALAHAGIHNAEREARWLAEAAAEGRGPLADLVARRVAGEPLQYLTGRAGFRYLELEVGPGVLIPRPETEVVVEHVLRRLPDKGTLVDVGTGSGAIALAVKQERPDARVVATDVSADALRWAELNRSRLGLDVGLVQGDLLDAMPDELTGRVDVVVSNPPYVGDDERHELPVDVRDHEPHAALFAGPHGMTVIERLAVEAPPWLAGGGWLVLEIAPRLSRPVRELLDSSGYARVAIHPDLTGTERVAEGRRA